MMRSVMGITWTPEQMSLSSHSDWASCGSSVHGPQDRRAGSQWPLSEADAFLLDPFGKSPGPPSPSNCKASLCPTASILWRKELAFVIRALCPPAPFWTHPKAEHGHMGSQHQAKAEGQLFAKLLVLASKPAAVSEKG